MAVVTHPFHKRTSFQPPSQTSISTDELEDRLLRAVLAADSQGTLPVVLSNPVSRYLRAQRESRSHMRGGMILSHDDYAEVAASVPMLREQIIDLCLRHDLFGAF